MRETTAGLAMLAVIVVSVSFILFNLGGYDLLTANGVRWIPRSFAVLLFVYYITLSVKNVEANTNLDVSKWFKKLRKGVWPNPPIKKDDPPAD